MKKEIRIGTRSSRLAVWQATQVAHTLQQNGYQTSIVPIKSEGDLDLQTPLYEMNVEGIFTRYLDAAVLTKKVDIAVHSMKDVPTTLARGLTQAAVLKRGPVRDLLLYKQSATFLNNPFVRCVIATGSVRRKAQWLHRYSNSVITGLRGNVNTRLRKLQENDWDGALFAEAGLTRIGLLPERFIRLDWMLSAPAQGAILVVCNKEDRESLEACTPMNDENTALCVRIERDFLRTLMGGCATPISALARIEGNNILFEGNVLTPDGKEKASITKKLILKNAANLGIKAGREILSKGGRRIIDQLTEGG